MPVELICIFMHSDLANFFFLSSSDYTFIWHTCSSAFFKYQNYMVWGICSLSYIPVEKPLRNFLKRYSSKNMLKYFCVERQAGKKTVGNCFGWDPYLWSCQKQKSDFHQLIVHVFSSCRHDGEEENSTFQ